MWPDGHCENLFLVNIQKKIYELKDTLERMLDERSLERHKVLDEIIRLERLQLEWMIAKDTGVRPSVTKRFNANPVKRQRSVVNVFYNLNDALPAVEQDLADDADL